MAGTNNWQTHDFAVKMIAWSASRGSTLKYRCRRCGRDFHQFTAASHDMWAVDGEGRPLQSIISNRWLAEGCPRSFCATDDEDRKQLSSSAAH